MAFTALSYSRIVGANERILLAQIGCGDRGEVVARGFVEDGAEFVRICDAHGERMQKHAALLSTLSGRTPKSNKNFLQVLEDREVDAVLIATPEHWHAAPMIAACQAGKDVYLEKPQSHNIRECRLMIKAAKKYNPIVQIGVQNRSAHYNIAARDLKRSGRLGDIRLVKVFHVKPGA